MHHRCAAIVFACLIALSLSHAGAGAAPAGKTEFYTKNAVVEWMDKYRLKPEPSRLPGAVRALSEANALREPEAAGYYVGFVAGVLATNPRQAERLIDRMLPLPPGDQWLVVRAIAYSGLPAWKSMLARLAARLPERRAMIDGYLSGRLPALDAIELDKSPTLLEKIRLQLGGKPDITAISYGNNPELIDTLWGFYFATGHYRPVWRMITLLPWSKDNDSAARLNAGSAAKYTLASNAARYPDLLALLKEMAPYQEDGGQADPRRGDPRRRDHGGADHQEAAARGPRRAQAQGPGLSARHEAVGLSRPGRDRGRLYRGGDGVAHRARPALRDRRRGVVGRDQLRGRAVEALIARRLLERGERA